MEGLIILLEFWIKGRCDTPLDQVPVQWQGKVREKETWEDRETVQEHFPSFILEDKVVLEGESIVRYKDKPMQVYYRIKGNNLKQ